jgi:hypothetical protein
MGSITKYWRAMPVVPIVLTAAIFIRPVAAQDIDAKGGKELTELGQKIDKAANRATPEQVVDKIVGEFKGKSFTFDAGGTPRPLAESDVRALRQKLGFGEISILLALANQSGKSVSDILAMRQSGEGWGELARDLKLKNLGSVIRSVKATEKGVDRAALQRSDRREDRLETAAKPDKPERMERPERPMRPEKPGR